MNNTAQNIVMLPYELWMIVFKDLDAEDLNSCIMVSKEWYQVGREDNLWIKLSSQQFGHNANLTAGSYAKLTKSWPQWLHSWKDWYDFRRMFRREVAGAIQVDFLEYICNGKLKKPSTAYGMFSCESQPVQKGTKNIVFHFCSTNTVLDAVFYRTMRFSKKVILGHVGYPLFALKHREENLWLDLDVCKEETEGSESAGNMNIKVHLKFTLKPVEYTVNDFEFVASISRGTTYTNYSHAELLYVRDRDTKKPYFMKIINNAAYGPNDQSTLPPTDTQLDNYTYMDTEGASQRRRSLQLGGYALASRWNIPPSPFIVDLFTSFRKGLSHYLVMEWVEGGELFSVVRRTNDGRFSEDAVRFYGSQLLLALSHLHLHGIIYRDLKPENILLDRKGHLKLTRRTPPQHEWDNGRTYRYNEYLAPEILAGLQVPPQFDHKCDWWSYGAILYQMLVGLPPFSHPSVNVTNMKIMQGDFTFPVDKTGKTISEEAKDLIHKLLNPSAKKRMDERQIRRHSFFNRVLDWGKLERREIKPPARPFRRNVIHRESLHDSSTTSDSSTTTTSQSSWYFKEDDFKNSGDDPLKTIFEI